MGKQDLLDNPAELVSEVNQDHKDLQDLLDQLAHVVRPVLLEHQDNVESQDKLELQVY